MEEEALEPMSSNSPAPHTSAANPASSRGSNTAKAAATIAEGTTRHSAVALSAELDTPAESGVQSALGFKPKPSFVL